MGAYRFFLGFAALVTRLAVDGFGLAFAFGLAA